MYYHIIYLYAPNTVKRYSKLRKRYLCPIERPICIECCLQLNKYVYIYIHTFIYTCSNLKEPEHITKHFTLTQRRSHELFSTMNMKSIKWSLEQTKLPEAVTRNMPKTVLWLLRHRASRQNYGVYIYIFNVAEPVSRAVVSPVVGFFRSYMVIYDHIPRICHWKKLEIGFKHQWIHPFPMWFLALEGQRAPFVAESCSFQGGWWGWIE